MSENEKYQLYLASREWAIIKEAIKKRCGGICERCRNAPMYAVHHMTYIRKYHERLEDLQGVCNPCHEYLSGKTSRDPINHVGDGVVVYLAGPISGQPWREELLKSTGHAHSENEVGRIYGDWEIAEDALPGGFSFCGPWREDTYGGHGGPDEQGSHCRDVAYGKGMHETEELDENKRAVIVHLCKKAIRQCDAVFVWIPENITGIPAGTLLEIGYAHALQKPIYCNYHPGAPHYDDCWFLLHMCDGFDADSSVEAAWNGFVKFWKRKTYVEQWR